jgi:hypothetical protein
MMKHARADIIMLYTLKALHFSNWHFDLLQMIGSKTTPGAIFRFDTR